MGKSVLTMQLAACAAAGVPFFRALAGGIRVPRPCRVLYIQAENDLPTLQRDLHGVMQAEKLAQAPLADNLRIVTYPGDTPARLGVFLTAACQQFAPDVIVIDPYTAFVGGDINSTELFFTFRDAISTALTNAAMLLVCHTPKPTDREHWTAREGVYMAAGTSALANWARCSCELTNPKADQDERYRLRLSKNAERAGLPLDIGGTIRRDIFLEHGHRDAPCWIVSECQQEERQLSMTDRLRQLLESQPGISQRECAKILGIGVANVCRRMKQMEQTEQ
ncbi:MAG: AAA family ATPase [bacterium]|nr:AAA family ATPase [bacterium]